MFSVVIPLYNKELSIQNTIQSVLNQTCQDFEIVVINDGSTDNSAKIVESIKDDRIRLIHQPNKGVSAARNNGIKEAKYEWIAFLDGDDLWESNHLEEITKMMNQFPKENVFVTSFTYSDNRAVFKHSRQASIFKIENYFKEALKESLIWTSIVVVNIRCFKKVGGFHEGLKHGEDRELWCRLAAQFEVVKSSKVTAIYRVEAENRSCKNQELDSSFAYIISFDGELTKYQYAYYLHEINYRLYICLRRREYSDFIRLYNLKKPKGFLFFLLAKIWR